MRSRSVSDLDGRSVIPFQASGQSVPDPSKIAVLHQFSHFVSRVRTKSDFSAVRVHGTDCRCVQHKALHAALQSATGSHSPFQDPESAKDLAVMHISIQAHESTAHQNVVAFAPVKAVCPLCQMPANDLKRFFADVLSILSTTMQKEGLGTWWQQAVLRSAQCQCR